MYMPLDVLNRKFKKGFVGYSTEEVDEFKEEIASDYEKLYKENIELKDKLDIINKALQHYKSMETALQNTLLIAQKTSEDIKNAAYQRADVIKKEGTVEAAIIISNAKHDVEKLKQERTFLKREYENFRVKFKAMLNSEMQLLDESLNIANDIEYEKDNIFPKVIEENLAKENVLAQSILEEKADKENFEQNFEKITKEEIKEEIKEETKEIDETKKIDEEENEDLIENEDSIENLKVQET